MNLKLSLLLCALLLSACSEKPQQAPDKNTRHYDEKTLALGDRVFHENCATCHGYNGEGKPGWQQPGPDGKLLPPPLDDSGRAWRLSSSQIKHFIHQGSPDGRSNMPPWQDKLTEQEIEAVQTWITSRWSDAVYLEWRTGVEEKKN